MCGDQLQGISDAMKEASKMGKVTDDNGITVDFGFYEDLAKKFGVKDWENTILDYKDEIMIKKPKWENGMIAYNRNDFSLYKFGIVPGDPHPYFFAIHKEYTMISLKEPSDYKPFMLYPIQIDDKIEVVGRGSEKIQQGMILDVEEIAYEGSSAYAVCGTDKTTFKITLEHLLQDDKYKIL